MPIHTRNQEFTHLLELTKKYDELLSGDSVTANVTNQYQKTLDDIDKRYTNPTNNETALMYEAQGLINLARGRINAGQEFVREAIQLVGVEGLVSNTARTVLPNSPVSAEMDTKGKKGTKIFSGKIEGWLALYALRIFVLPLYLIYDLVSTRNSLNGVDTTTPLGSSVNSYMSAATVGDIAGIVGAVYIISLFLKKFVSTRRAALIFEGYMAIYYLVFAIWLDNIYTSNNLTDSSNDVGQLSWGFILALIWVLYWKFSKRAKATFVK